MPKRFGGSICSRAKRSNSAFSARSSDQEMIEPYFLGSSVAAIEGIALINIQIGIGEEPRGRTDKRRGMSLLEPPLFLFGQFTRGRNGAEF